jgi:phosphocarrier protein
MLVAQAGSLQWCRLLIRLCCSAAAVFGGRPETAAQRHQVILESRKELIRMIEAVLKITNPTGLHARPAAQLVQKAASFCSKVMITANNKAADAKSILSVMSMGLNCGTEITVTADGADEKECLAALVALIEGNFGEG